MLNHDDLIIRHFKFLMDEYGYHIEEKEFSPEAMGNAYVTFKSELIGIEIVIDRNQVLVTIGDQLQPRAEWFEFTDTLKYFAPLEIPYEFGEKTGANTWEDVIEFQLSRLATIFRQYCDPLLKGDLSMKAEIQLIEDKRVDEMLKRYGKQTQAYLEYRAKKSK